jgi:hypothetical protein
MPKQRVDPVIRFWAKVDKSGECWIWQGAKTYEGYGLHDGQVAHRFIWEQEHGPIPPGMKICHNCPGGDNPSCVRLDHLFQGTQADNLADMARKGRCGVISPENVRRVRAEYAAGANKKDLQNKYHVSYGVIQGIITGRSWRAVV